MKFRESIGLAWMAGMFTWQIENTKFVDIVFRTSSVTDVINVLVLMILWAAWTFGIGYLIGWAK